MMDKLMNFIEARRATREERGASAVEYGLLIAGIAALIVVAVFALGPVVHDAFSSTCSTISTNDDNDATVAASCDNG